MAYKTPGVYIEEIAKFPPSVAEVETAVPAFIGYTEKAERRGEDLTFVPVRIRSLLEYNQYFGFEPRTDKIDIKVDHQNNHAVLEVKINKQKFMYEALRVFFDNGGGKCYIVSVGKHTDDVEFGNDTTGLKGGVKALEKYDEPTMILFPDATLLTTEPQFYSLQQAALAQCAKLQDRVGVFDLFERRNDGWDKAVETFRNQIGINDLKYGAAYTPWLRTSYPRTVDFSLFADNVKNKSSAKVELHQITSNSDLNNLVLAAQSALADVKTVETAVTGWRSTSPSLKDRYKALRDAVTAAKNEADNKTAFREVLGLVRKVANEATDLATTFTGANLKLDLKAYGNSSYGPPVEKLVTLEKNAGVVGGFSDLADVGAVNTAYAKANGSTWLSKLVTAINPTEPTRYTTGTVYQKPQLILADLDDIFQGGASLVTFLSQVQDAAAAHARLTQATLYQSHPVIANMVEAIRKEMALVPPSGAVAGVYAYTDRTRGVWKAPANVSLSAVSEPAEQIDFFEQEELNVDVTGGKSINAIRTFTGLGTLVWGARTLAGNDNEWRYVPVRRFFNMVEESVKKSTGWAVFEPNDANLWTKVKSMIDNYLIQKWRDGALAGATPDQAFYVKIGLGQTMTAQDILEGRLIVEIGMAVVRPAEFIILRFSHKMQES